METGCLLVFKNSRTAHAVRLLSSGVIGAATRNPVARATGYISVALRVSAGMLAPWPRAQRRFRSPSA